MISTTFRFDFCGGRKNQSKHSTLNSSFDALSKLHKPDVGNKDFYGWLRNNAGFPFRENMWSVEL